MAALFAAGGPPSALAAKAATSTIPVVFSAVSDPVRLGLVPSLNRPGGNVTGMSFLNAEIIGKSAQLLKEMVPAAAGIAFLVNPSGPSAEIYAKEAPAAARALGIRVPVLDASTEQDLDKAFASLGKIGADGLVVPAEPFFDSQRDRIVVLAARYRGAHDVQPARIRRGRRADELWRKPAGLLSPGRHLCGPRSQGRKPRRPPGHAADQIRSRHQSDDRQSTRPHHPTEFACHRRRGDRMRRREFITLLGGMAAAWPLFARAQPTTLPAVGFLNSASAQGYSSMATAFKQGLKEAGYTEGQNVAIEYRWADNQYERLPALAADLVNRRVNVIFANSPSIPAALAATKTIPIIFNSGGDPVRLGFVASLNRPGGNASGVAILAGELAAKRLEVLRELVPNSKTIAVLINTDFGPSARFPSRCGSGSTRARAGNSVSRGE